MVNVSLQVAMMRRYRCGRLNSRQENGCLHFLLRAQDSGHGSGSGGHGRGKPWSLDTSGTYSYKRPEELSASYSSGTCCSQENGCLQEDTNPGMLSSEV